MPVVCMVICKVAGQGQLCQLFDMFFCSCDYLKTLIMYINELFFICVMSSMSRFQKQYAKHVKVLCNVFTSNMFI